MQRAPLSLRSEWLRLLNSLATTLYVRTRCLNYSTVWPRSIDNGKTNHAARLWCSQPGLTRRTYATDWPLIESNKLLDDTRYMTQTRRQCGVVPCGSYCLGYNQQWLKSVLSKELQGLILGLTTSECSFLLYHASISFACLVGLYWSMTEIAGCLHHCNYLLKLCTVIF